MSHIQLPSRRPASPPTLSAPVSTCSVRLWRAAVVLLAIAVLGAAALAATTPKRPADPLAQLKFRNLGPAVAGGRVTAVAGIPNQPGVYYIGAAAGGVFKTTDGGNHWKAIFRHQPTASIGSIAIAPSNPNLVWVGTGEPNPRGDVIDGRGVYFSPDGGLTWQARGLDNAGPIARILVNPQNPDEVWVAALGTFWAPSAERGVFHTTDGGKTWQKTLFINDQTGVVDLAMQPGNPRVLFAATWQVSRNPWSLTDGGPGSGVYRSLDGGLTWTKLSKGLPDAPLGRIGLATSPADPQVVYALIEAKSGVLWRSGDLGNHWSQVSDNRALDVRSFYFTHVLADPTNANHLYFLAFRLLESNDGGKTVHRLGKGVHPDHHALWIDPTDPHRMLEGNDGGVYLTLNGGKSWRFLNNLPIEQYYSVALDSRRPFHICGGLQDNSAWCGASTALNGDGVTGRNWEPVIGGDGEYSVPAPSDPNIIYSNLENGVTRRLDLRTHASVTALASYANIFFVAPWKSKYRFNWTSPLAVSFTDPNSVYMGANVLFHSTDGGAHWNVISPDLTRNDPSHHGHTGGPVNEDYSGAETDDTILSIALSRLNPLVIWVGTDDGLVQVTRDGGKTWHNVTGGIPGVGPWGMIRQISVSPFHPGTAYVAIDRHEMNDRHPYVFKTSDYGQTWTSITSNLPADNPVHVVREDPNRPGFLVAGTDTSLFYSADTGAHWTKFRSNFPTAPVFDLKFDKPSHSLVVATHGRGVFVLDNLTPLEESTSGIAAAAFHLFPLLPATESVRWSAIEEPSGVTYSAPNAPAGAMVDYWLKAKIKVTPEQKKKHETPVKIEIHDAAGHFVNTLYGKSAGGYNRAVWKLNYRGERNLRFGTPKAEKSAEFVQDGPAVLAGRYRVTVTVNGQSQSQWVTVHEDPGFHQKNPANARRWLELALNSRHDRSTLALGLNRLNSLQTQLESEEKTLGETSSADSEALVKQAKALGEAAKKLENVVYQTDVQRAADEDELKHPPDLYRRMQYFNGMARTENPNFTVNQAAVEEQQATHALLVDWFGEYNHFLATEVDAFNRLARQHGAPIVVTGGPITAR